MNEMVVAEATLQPEPGTWTAADPARGGLFASARRATRQSMGLDPTRPVLATGHQAAIWHPGILVKDLALSSLVARLASGGDSSDAIHYIADHDANDGGLVAYPAPGPTRCHWRMLPPTDGRATRDCPAAPPSAPPKDVLRIEGVSQGIEAIHAAVSMHADADNLAWQLGLATQTLAEPFSRPVPRHSMSGLLQMPIGLELIERMRDDPGACIQAHDAAIEAERRDRTGTSDRVPRAVARPLHRGSIQELPLWRSTPEGRRPVLRGETIEPEACRPRALLATALARLGGCDLFVHGLGGGIYDPAMEDWIHRWLGEDALTELAPAPLATATLTLPIPLENSTEASDVSPEGLHRMLSDPDLARTDLPRRGELLAGIDRAAPRSRERRSAFDALRREIELARNRGRQEIDQYRNRLAAEGRKRRRRDVATDRSWAFPLHRAKALRGLVAEIDALFVEPLADSTQRSPKGRGR